MEIFLVSFILMLIVVAIMAVGYIFQQKKIKGSCGGISDLGLEKVCDCDEPCDKRKELIRRQQAQKRAEEELIDIKLINEDNN